MKELEERILLDGRVLNGDILKVDSFLNHQIDVALLDHIGEAFHHHFLQKNITKVLTIEASGIAIGCFTAKYFNVPLVFAKKAKSANLEGELLKSHVHSFTYNRDYEITVAQRFIQKDDVVLIVDDFMANGLAVEGLIDIVEQAGATVGGIGIAIEKGFQEGGQRIRAKGYELCSLAIIDTMSPDEIRFK